MATVYRRKKQSCKKWMIRWYDAETEKWHAITGYADKQASLALGERLELEAARRAEGLVNPHDHNKQTIQKHLDDYIMVLETRRRSEKYVMQVRNRVTRVVKSLGITKLTELDPVRITKFLMELDCDKKPMSDITRNEYITSLRSFSKWAVEARRIEYDPLTTLKRTERKHIKPSHPRRALTMEEIGRLLDATVRRPLLEVMMIRIGKNKGKPVARVSWEVREQKMLLGRNRKIAYMLAFWLGLRRNEIAQLTWGDVHLDIMPPQVCLRADTTKSKRADVQMLHPQLAEELKKWKPKDAEPTDKVVSSVPSMKVLIADLKLAGIEYGNDEIGFADLHAQRKSLSTAMAANNLSQRVRQAHMRHTDPRLTEVTYMDPKLLPVAAEIASMPWIPEVDSQADKVG